MEERLQKYLARSGVASRRHSEELIAEGHVKVNGKTVNTMGYLVNPEKDRIQVDGRLVKPVTSYRYYMLNKPMEVVSTCSDPQGRSTVLDYLPDDARLYPIGRLDYMTEGLLLVTNDGELANSLMHPKKEVKKKYLVETKGLLTDMKKEKLEKGVKLEDGITRPADVQIEFASEELSKFYLTIHEGKNRQVRRMCEAVGLKVDYLCRVQEGGIRLGNLGVGQYRKLTDVEIEKLKRL